MTVRIFQYLQRLPFAKIAYGPILSALVRQKYAFSMLVLQVALTLAVISNGLFIVCQRLEVLQATSGIDEAYTFALTSSGFAENFDPQTSMQTDLAEIRQLPNIINAVATYSFPYSGSGVWDELQSTNNNNQTIVPAASYKLDEHGINTLGLALIAGENFNSNEVLWQTESNLTLPSTVIITSSVASQLFNTQDWSSVIGKTIFINVTHSAIVKGIVRQLHGPINPVGQAENSIIYPRVVTRNSARYLVRTKPGELLAGIDEVERHLGSSNQQRMVRNVQSIQTLRTQAYGPDIAAVAILLVVMTMLSVIAAMGIAGVASFNVLQRQKQIGIRRALGASKIDILSHFIAENIIQTTCGVIIGCLFAYGLNIFLVTEYALPKLPILYVVMAMLFLYVIGITATIKPSLKATNISPSEVTKAQ